MKHLTMHHHELSTGAIHRVPLHLESKYAVSLEKASDEACRTVNYAQINGTNFRLFSDFTRISAGVAVFVIVPAESITEMPRGSVAAQAAVACELATAPEAWRLVMGPYAKFVSSSRAFQNCHAPGEMPRAMPWLCSFLTPRAGALSAERRSQLIELIRVFGLIALERCRLGAAVSKRAGVSFEPNADVYEELRDSDFLF